MGIEIYPKSLDDLDIKCKFKNESLNKIDALSVLNVLNKKLIKNQFLIFKIKGMEIEKPAIEYKVKTIDDIFENKFKAKSKRKTLKNLFNINVVLLNDLSNNHNYEVIYNELFKSLIDEVKPGEIMGFIGRNGAGKTTTLKSKVKSRNVIMKNGTSTIRFPLI